MSRAAQLSSFIKSATSRLPPRVRHLSLSALQSSAYQQGGFRAQYGGAPTTSSAANIFSDWSQEPTAQTLVPFVVEQSVSFVYSYRRHHQIFTNRDLMLTLRTYFIPLTIIY